MTRPAPAPLLPALAVATTILVWAAAFPAIKLALAGMEPLPLASARFAMAATLAALWLLWRRPGRMQIADLTLCAACGLLGGAGYAVFLNLGQTTVSAGAASFLVKTESLWMALLGVLALCEAFNRWAWGGTLLGFAGVAVIASAQPGGIAFGGGAVFVLAAAACSAVGFVLQRRLVQRYGAMQVAAVMFVASAIALSPWLPEAAAQLQAATPAVRGWVVFLGILPTTVGLLCWTYAMGQFGAARAGNFLYLVAPLAMALAWLMSGETPAATTLAGGALVLLGVMLVNTRGTRPAAVPATAGPGR